MRQAAKKSSKQPKPKKHNAKKRKKIISTRTSTNIQHGPVIEEHVLPVSNNGYHESISQHEIREQRNFVARMRYRAKKASEQPIAKKPKLIRAQEEQKKAKSTRTQYNMNTATKKKHIENNKNVLPDLININNIPLHVPNSTTLIHVITQRQHTPTTQKQ